MNTDISPKSPHFYSALFSKIFVFALFFAVAKSTLASDFFWTNPFSQSQESSVLNGENPAYKVSSFNNANKDFHYDQTRQTDAYSALSLTRYYNENDAVYFQYSQKDEQEGLVLGLTHDKLSVSYMAGSGENYAKLTGAYAGINPYAFHGGWNQKFDFSGFAIDYQFNKLRHVQFGQAELRAQSNFLQNRKTQYFEWSNAATFTRISQFSRGGQTIGHGFDMGFAMNENLQMAFQSIRLDGGKSVNRIRFKFDGKRSRQYWLDVSSLQNDLYRANNEVSVMMFFKTALGQPRLYSSLDSSKNEVDVDGGDPKKKKKKKRVHRGVYIGVGVAAIAALASSGSSSSDSSVRLRTQQEAAFDVLNNINPKSVRENREYGGWVFRNPDGSFSSTNPVRGDATSVRLPSFSVIPSGSVATASYHTHAAFDPRFDNENFSSTDLETDRANNVDGYLATPGGQFKYHNHRTGEVVTLGVIAN